ncbi:MAG: SlyX family protein [Devosia sp.]
MPDDLAARIEKLETMLAYQDQAIEDLNKTITEQWSEIAALKRLCGDLGTRLREIADNPALAEGPEPPPPHY